LAARTADEAILRRIAPCHEKIKEDTVKGIDQRMNFRTPDIPLFSFGFLGAEGS
jgi:hypothetical protein